MSAAWWIARREWNSFLQTPLGYWVAAAVLFLHGLWFHVVVMRGEQSSFKVVEGFFFHSSGFVAVFAVLTSMRLIAEERQSGTLVLLQTSPVREGHLVFGKFLGGLAFLTLYIGLSGYMPLLVVVHGKVALGHLLAGYLGLWLLGAAVMAIGTFASSLASSQLLSAVIAGVITMAFFVCWMVARKVEGTLGDLVGYLDFMDLHFRPFSRGVVQSSAIVYFLSLTWLWLLAATALMSARRWRG